MLQGDGVWLVLCRLLYCIIQLPFYKVFSVNKKQEEIARKLLSYLRKNPDATDTLEGISKWWLESERIEESVDEVEEILVELVDEGMLNITKSGNGFIYKVNKETFYDPSNMILKNDFKSKKS